MSESLKSLEMSFPPKEFQMWTGGEEAGIFIVFHSGKDSIKRIVIGQVIIHNLASSDVKTNIQLIKAFRN